MSRQQLTLFTEKTMALYPYNFSAAGIEDILNSGGLNGKTYHVLLFSGNAFTSASTFAAVTAAEISGNGYARQPAAFAAGTFDAAQDRLEFSSVVTFAAAGGSIVYDGFALLNAAQTDLIGLQVETNTQTIGAGQSVDLNLDLNFGNPEADLRAA